MSAGRKRVLNYLTYLVVRLVLALLRALPYRTACRAGDGLAWLVRKIDRRHRLVAKDNLRHAFPGSYTDAELDVFAADVYRHFCRMIVEIAHLDRRVRITNWRDYLDYSDEDAERTIRTLLCGRPVLLVTPHFGNWELSSYVMGLLGFKIFAIARPLDNPYLDAWLRRWREATGQKMIAKKGEFDRIEEVLRAGNVLGTLGDQDAGARGMFVNFFNRPASTHKAVALLAIEYNVPMMVMGAARVGEPMRYRIHVEDVIEPAEYQNRPDAVRAITQRFTEGLERLIRRYPRQYFWLHRRWKHQPPVAKAKAKAA